jgi:hypothetical protein
VNNISVIKEPQDDNLKDSLKIDVQGLQGSKSFRNVKLKALPIEAVRKSNEDLSSFKLYSFKHLDYKVSHPHFNTNLEMNNTSSE